MQQATTQQVPIIDLEPIGGGQVSEEEFQSALEQIIGAVMGTDSTGTTPTQPTANQQPEPSGPSINWNAVKRYGLYAGGTVAAIYLIGKALQ